MKPSYLDIINRAGEPLWFDENGTPRYIGFQPSKLANPGACECALIKIQCQCCEHPFLCSISWSKYDPLNKKKITEGSIFYKDPPNIGCCPAGATMTSDLIEIVELWTRDPSTYEWLKSNRSDAEHLLSTYNF